jgi:hypothetical protein
VTGDLRNTGYAREIARASVDFRDGTEGRIELLFVKSSQQEEIRFSWWRNGRMVPRPLDLPEEALLELLEDAVRQGVFSPDFLRSLKRIGDSLAP